MNIEITRVSVSKKGVVWIQAKATEASEELKEGDVFECIKTDNCPDPDKKEKEEK